MIRRCKTALLLAALPFSVAACASTSTEHAADTAKARLDEVAAIQATGVDVELIDGSGATARDKDAKIDAALEKSAAKCSKIYPDSYVTDMKSALDEARLYGSKESLYRLPAKAVELDKQFADCLSEFGLRGRFVLFGKDGKYWSVSDHMLELLARGEAYQVAGTQLNIEREENRRLLITALAAASAASATMVRRYPGACYYTWQIASDGSQCGNRAASIRPGGW